MEQHVSRIYGLSRALVKIGVTSDRGGVEACVVEEIGRALEEASENILVLVDALNADIKASTQEARQLQNGHAAN